MTTGEDRVRQIAERVARRVAGGDDRTSTENPANETRQPLETPRARVIDFISAGPPVRTTPSIGQSAPRERTSEPGSAKPPAEYFQFVPVTQSPWLGRLPSMLGNNPPAAISNAQPVSHPSQERFGVEEAAVAELVEFFENEKKCTVEPGGKPCDHCAMCSSRGF
ncbi:MAG TPA: hypothetical protein VJT71_16950 [Pyrinomonadaceae bacterium]|nr:hypothetical protein [Pyrinomonadaceae bacterium]